MKLVALGTALVLAAAVPAAAAPARLPCAVIVDDQRGLVETTVGDRWRDMLGAALGSDQRHVTAVLALSALPTSPSRPEHAAVDYTMRFTVDGTVAFLTVPASEQGAATYGVELGARPLVLGTASVVRDARRQQLRVTAPLTGFAPFATLRPGLIATRLNALVAVTPSAPASSGVARAQTIVVDGLDGKAQHRLGVRSCVPVGK